MSILTYIIIFTLLGSVVSLVGGVALLFKEKFAHKISHYLSSFAAGALLATAFFDLLPEAVHEAEHFNMSEKTVFLWVLLGLLGFFLLERFIHWFHHHSEDYQVTKDKSVVSLVTLGDSIHNFIDGIAIAATFMVSIPLGIVTTFAVAAHEIPQEIGDFGILLHKGIKRGRVLLINFVSALAAVLGALIMYGSGESIEGFLPIFLSLAAGFFIYIAASDLIPEIHMQEKRKVAVIETLLLLLGVLVVYLAIGFVESLGLH